MRNYSLNTLARCWFLLGVLALSGCVGIDVRADQTILISNAGSDDVLDFQVLYGDYEFPKVPDDRLTAEGGHQYTVTIPTPREATVVWTTLDGRQHRETIAILSNVQGKSWFDGESKILFEVNNAVLQVFLIRRLPKFKQERHQIR